MRPGHRTSGRNRPSAQEDIVNLGLLILRVVLGMLLVGHGTQKLFGWWGGHGRRGTGMFFHDIGHRPGVVMATVAGMSEAGGGLLLALGFLSPLGSAIVIGVMLVAASTHAHNGLWSQNGGFELPAFYAVNAAALACTGPGRFSIDEALGWADNSHWWPYALLAITLGVAMATLTITRARTLLAREARAAAVLAPDRDYELIGAGR
jgi:putative oxidoreductase